MESIDIALALGIFGFSIIVLITSFYSYYKTRVSKLLPICLAFSLFMLKGLYFIFEVLNNYNLSTSIRVLLGLDFVIIILIYIAVAKR